MFWGLFFFFGGIGLTLYIVSGGFGKKPELKKYLPIGVGVGVCFIMIGALTISNHTYSQKDKYSDSSSTYSSYGTYSTYSYSGYSNKTYFTNKYGTSTTKCAVSGCSRYIASSGDTNCCTTHSNRCGECHCYIDGDAMFCMDCIYDALY